MRTVKPRQRSFPLLKFCEMAESIDLIEDVFDLNYKNVFRI